MRTKALCLAVMAAILWASDSYGQKAAEMFIPIGKSPGLSGKLTYLGSIGKVDAEAKTVVAKEGDWKATVTEKTKIWLDRSAAKLPNREGTFADLVADRTMEIKYEGKEKVRSGNAEWIKVEVKN